METLQLVEAITHKGALRYFHRTLKEFLREKGATNQFSGNEIVHVSSVLAHYSQTQCVESGLDTADELTMFFHSYMHGELRLDDPDFLTAAGARTLFLAGYFRLSASRRHNPEWFSDMGKELYGRASLHAAGPRQYDLYTRMASNFPAWSLTCAEFQGYLHDNRYLIQLH